MVNNSEEIFNLIHKEDFKALLELANQIQPIDVDALYKGYVDDNAILKPLYDTWAIWEDIDPAFYLYGRPEYLNESFECWKKYSRRYILLLKKYIDSAESEIDRTEIKTVLDLGCGCAFSTVGLASIFPTARIFATNLEGSVQFEIDKEVTREIPQCEIFSEDKTFCLNGADLVFASEFFEHIKEPIAWLRHLISSYHPKYFVFANTFTKMSLGHFTRYMDHGTAYTGREISRLFNDTLRANGYKKVNTGFFNNRPQVFKYIGDSSRKLF